MRKWLNLRMEIIPLLNIEINNTYEYYLGKDKIIYLKKRFN